MEITPTSENSLPSSDAPFDKSDPPWIIEQVRGHSVAVIGCSDISLLVSLVEEGFKVTAYDHPSSVERVLAEHQNMAVSLREALHQTDFLQLDVLPQEWNFAICRYGGYQWSAGKWCQTGIGHRVHLQPVRGKRSSIGCCVAGIHHSTISSVSA